MRIDVTTFYEVWDDDSNNRVGGPFETQAEAEALLGDVVRANGPEAASEMAVIMWRERPAGGFDAATVLEGSTFVERVRAKESSSGVPAGSSTSGASGVMGAHGTSNVREYGSSKRPY